MKFSKDGGEPLAIAADLRLNAAGKTYQVFDMQGRALGKVDVAAGASIDDALFAKFQQTGVYMDLTSKCSYIVDDEERLAKARRFFM